MTRSLSRRAVFALPLLLAGCAATPPPPVLPELSFAHLPRIGLDVATIDVRQVYQPPLRAPHVEHQMPLQPALAAERWARDRLRAAGAAGSARFSVLEASVIAVPLETQSGLRGLFTAEQSERYEAKLSVLLEVLSPGGQPLAQAEARTSRVRTLGEKLTINQRHRAEFEMVEALMADLNVEMERQIRRHMERYVTGAVR
jgi:hypothetical protein